MNKYTLLLLIALSSPLQAESILPTECIIDVNATHAQQLQQVINILNYVREENKDVADKLEELSDLTDEAFEEGSLAKIIDIIIQALIYATGRLKNYDENFIDYVRGIQKDDNNVDIARASALCDDMGLLP